MDKVIKFKALYLADNKVYDVIELSFDGDSGASNIILGEMQAYGINEPVLGIEEVELFQFDGIDANGEEVWSKCFIAY